MKKLLFFGDSITEMSRYRNVQEHQKVFTLGSGFVFVIASELSRRDPTKYEIINEGIGGNTVIGLFNRYQKDVLPYKADLLTILVGINDLGHIIENRGDGVDLETFEKTYDKMISNILKEQSGLPIILMAPFVTIGLSTKKDYDKYLKIKEYAKAVKRIADKYGLHFISLQEKFDEAVKKYPTEFITYDGVHPQVAGATIIADEWLKYFDNKISL